MSIITGGPCYSTLYIPQVGIFYKVDVMNTHTHSNGDSSQWICYHRIDGIMDEYVATGGPYYSDSRVPHDGVFYDVDVSGDRVYEMGSSSHDIRYHLFYQLEDLAQNMFTGGIGTSDDFPSNFGYGAFSVWIRGQIYKRPRLGSPH